MNPVSIIIPWRPNGDPLREENLEAVLEHLAPLGWPLILASDNGEDGEPFNRSRAFNNGMRLSPADVWIFNESDMLVPLDQLDDGAAVAQRRLGLVVPFTRYRYFGPEASRLVLSGVKPETLFPDRIMDNGTAVGAVGIASAASMAAVGRWDEKFQGHGYDDRGMYHAFRAACGPGTYVEGDATHLYHEQAYSPWERTSAAASSANYSEDEVRATTHNRARMRRYLAAQTPEEVRALTLEDA